MSDYNIEYDSKARVKVEYDRYYHYEIDYLKRIYVKSKLCSLALYDDSNELWFPNTRWDQLQLPPYPAEKVTYKVGQAVELKDKDNENNEIWLKNCVIEEINGNQVKLNKKDGMVNFSSLRPPSKEPKVTDKFFFTFTNVPQEVWKNYELVMEDKDMHNEFKMSILAADVRFDSNKKEINVVTFSPETKELFEEEVYNYMDKCMEKVPFNPTSGEQENEEEKSGGKIDGKQISKIIRFNYNFVVREFPEEIWSNCLLTVNPWARKNTFRDIHDKFKKMIHAEEMIFDYENREIRVKSYSPLSKPRFDRLFMSYIINYIKLSSLNLQLSKIASDIVLSEITEEGIDDEILPLELFEKGQENDCSLDILIDENIVFENSDVVKYDKILKNGELKFSTEQIPFEFLKIHATRTQVKEIIIKLENNSNKARVTLIGAESAIKLAKEIFSFEVYLKKKLENAQKALTNCTRVAPDSAASRITFSLSASSR